MDSVTVNRLPVVLSALALGAAAAVAQQGGPPPGALIRQGLIALQSRDIPKAQEYLERAVELAPTEARAWIGLAQVHRILNLHAQARRDASEAARLGKDNPLIQHALAMFYSEYGNWAEAANWEEKYANGSDGNQDAYLRAISLYLQADMPLQATKVGQAALAHGGSGELHNALGKAFTMANRPVEGLRHLELAVEALPYEESVHYDLGQFHLQQQDFNAAREAFLVGRKYFDKSAAMEIGLGIAAFGQRRFQRTVDHFLRATTLAPEMEQAHAFLGRMLQHASERIEEVEERMRAFYMQHSESHFGPFLYGQVLLAKLGTKRDSASISNIESLLRESIERNDDFWESHYELGVLLEKKRDFRAAEEHLERAVELNPDSSKPHYRLARVYQRLGKSKEAKRHRELHKRIAGRERQVTQVGGLPPELAPAAVANSR